jgi:hypothetical protein
MHGLILDQHDPQCSAAADRTNAIGPRYSADAPLAASLAA